MGRCVRRYAMHRWRPSPPEHRAFSTGIEACRQGSGVRSGAPGQRRDAVDDDGKGAGWRGGMASRLQASQPLCSEVTCGPLLCNQAESCPLRHELPGPFGTARRTRPSTASAVRLQLDIICGLLPQIWHRRRDVPLLLLLLAAQESEVSHWRWRWEAAGSRLDKDAEGLFLLT